MELTDEQWNMVKNLFPAETGRRGRPAKDNRPMVNAILWILRTGAPWRDLPKCYDYWKSVYTRFSRWSKQGIWDKGFDHFRMNYDNESNMIDSSVIKARQHAAGGAKGGQQFQALGRSRGVFTTKIHLVSDVLGLPLKIRLTGGHVHDSVPAIELLKGMTSDYILADRGYDSSEIVEFIKAHGAKSVIP